VLRLQSGLLCAPEARVVNYLVWRVPAEIGPDHLTFVAFAGAFLSGAALVSCAFSNWFLLPFALGLAMNWFGDSLDGALARHRSVERERAGFLIDRCCDVLCFSIIILGLGQSPYLPAYASFMLLVAYLINAIYGLLRAVVDQHTLIGFGGIGATEGRLFVIFWVFTLNISGIDLSSIQLSGISLFQPLCWALMLGVFAVFIRRIWGDVARIEGAGDGRELRTGAAEFPTLAMLLDPTRIAGAPLVEQELRLEQGIGAARR
jgi:archaetidylinositol phosphate synthase